MRKAKVQPSEELKDVIADPLDDLEIRHYLPDAKICSLATSYISSSGILQS